MTRLMAGRSRIWAACVGVVVLAAGLLVADGTRRARGPVTDVCPDLVHICDRQAAEIALPVSGASLALTYSSDRQRQYAVSEDLRRWVEEVGLGGWTLDIGHGLSADRRVFFAGNGGYRAVAPLLVRSGPHADRLAVASVDAAEVYLFDSDGRHVSTVDPLTGRVRRSFTYVDGRLAGVAAPDGSALSVRVPLPRRRDHRDIH